LDPRGPADKRHDLCARRHELPRANQPLAYRAVASRNDARVTQIYLRNSERGFIGVDIGDDLDLLRLDDGPGAAPGFRITVCNE